jgi:hypothetical protein
MAGLMRSRASPRGYLFAHPSEDRKTRATEPLRIEFTADTSITEIKRKQAIQKMLLKNQSVPNKLLPSDGTDAPSVFNHHPEQRTIAD